jgi:hypothetical protein
METVDALNHSLRPNSWKALQQKLSGAGQMLGQQVTDTSKRLTVCLFQHAGSKAGPEGLRSF